MKRILDIQEYDKLSLEEKKKYKIVYLDVETEIVVWGYELR